MAKHHGMKKHEKKGGGRVGMVASGNPEVLREANDDADGAETGHKKGGKVKAKKDKRATGGKVLGLMTGGGVKARLDRPGRKAGGAVGANRSPLSTAHNTSSSAGSSEPKDTYGGTP